MSSFTNFAGMSGRATYKHINDEYLYRRKNDALYYLNEKDNRWYLAKRMPGVPRGNGFYKVEPMRTIEQIEADLKANNQKLEELEAEVQKSHQIHERLMSEGFKLKYGYAFGDIFQYAGKNYVLIDDKHIRQTGAKNSRRAEGIRDFFKGESDSPFKRKPFKWEGKLILK